MRPTTGPAGGPTRRTFLGAGGAAGALLGLFGAGALTACNPTAQAPAPASGPSGELTWLIADDGGTEGHAWFEQTLIPAYQQPRPKMQVTMLYSSWTDFGQKRDTLYAAGQGPDILQSGAGLSHSYRKLVIPLDDRLRRWKEWADYYPATLATSRWLDKPYGIPARIDARAMIFRQDLFQREGLQLSTTWDEFHEAALRLSKRQGDQVAQVAYDPASWDDPNFGSQRLIPKLWQNGAEVVSDDGKKVLFNSPEGVEALRWWTDLLTTIAPPGANLPPAPANAERVAGGTAAAIEDGQWILTHAIATVPEAVPQLVVRPPLKQKRAQINVFTNWFGIGSQGKLPDPTWDLLMLFNQADNILEYCRLVGSTLPRKNLPETAYTSDPRYQIKAWAEILDKYSRPQPLTITQTGTNAGQVLSQAMTAVRQGQQSPKQALDEAARLWQEYIDGGYRELGL